jgi:hypothetical protein
MVISIEIFQNTFNSTNSSFKWSFANLVVKTTNAKIRATTAVLTQASNDTLRFYPNPVSSFVTLSKTSDCSLYNSLGMNVLSRSGTAIDVSNLSKRMYILKLKETTFKVLVN